MKNYTLAEMQDRCWNLIRKSEPTVIIAGHYPLIEIKAEVKGSLDSFGYFSKYTFEIACKFISKAKKENVKTPKILLLVDDHALMNMQEWYLPEFKGFERAEQIRSAVEKYYKKFTIPKEYSQILKKYKLTEEILINSEETHKKVFAEHLYRLKSVSEKEIIFGDHETSCAKELTQVFAEVSKKGFKQMLSFIPQRCQGPTCHAMSQNNTDNAKAGRNTLEKITFFFVTDKNIKTDKQLEKAGITFIGNKELTWVLLRRLVN